MARTATLPVLNGESGLSRYLAEIRKFPMLEPQQEYMDLLQRFRPATYWRVLARRTEKMRKAAEKKA